MVSNRSLLKFPIDKSNIRARITLCGLNSEGKLELFKMLGVVPDDTSKANLGASLASQTVGSGFLCTLSDK